MTEYEIADIGAAYTANILDMTSQQNDVIALYVTVVFAFIAACHITGRQLNKVQTTVATALFCIVCFWLVWRITQYGLGINYLQDSVAHHISSQGGDLDSLWRDGIAGNWRVLMTVSVWLLGMVGALIFLWDIRHRSRG